MMLEAHFRNSIRSNSLFSRSCSVCQRGCTGVSNADQALKDQASDAITLSFLMAQCRAEQNSPISEVMDSSSEEVWYGLDGDGEVCATPPAACAKFDYEKEFVDLCIEKSGKAKTCGCGMRCSVKLEYTRLLPAPGSAVRKVEVSSDPAQNCTGQERATINGLIENRRTGSDEDRCIEDFFVRELWSVASLRSLLRLLVSEN